MFRVLTVFVAVTGLCSIVAWSACGILDSHASTVTRGDLEADRAQLERAAKSGDPDQFLDALELCRGYDDIGVAKILLKYGLQNPEILVHKMSFEILAAMNDATVKRHLGETMLDAKAWEIRAQLTRIVATYGGNYALNQLKKAAEDKKWQVRSAAYRGFEYVRLRPAIDFLIERLKVETGRLLSDIGFSLTRLTGEELDAVHSDWNSWWSSRRANFTVPRRDHILVKLKQQNKKDVQTAVRRGLYGEIYSENVAFLLDVSSSMKVGSDLGSRLQIATSQLASVLQNLSKTSAYNIVTFSTEAQPFHAKLRRVRKRAVEKDVEKLGELVAKGETNPLAALEIAFKDQDVDTIYLLTDGHPTAGTISPQIIRYTIEKWNRDRRVIINCIGFFPGEAKDQDKQQAREFLEQLAQENEGFYVEIF